MELLGQRPVTIAGGNYRVQKASNPGVMKRSLGVWAGLEGLVRCYLG